MERILTQEEIDQLLAAFDEGEIDASSLRQEEEKPGPGAGGRKQIAKIDLTKGQNYSKWRIANLDVVFNSFARYYSIALTNSLQQGITISKGEVMSKFFEDFIHELKSPGVLGAFSLEPLKGSGLLVFDRKLCFGLVEVLFGMSDTDDFVVLDREVTAIEANIIRGLMSEGCKVFNRAFSALDYLNSSITKVDTNPRALNILAPETEVIQVEFSARLGSLEGEIIMVIPYFSLEPFKERLRNEGLQLDEGAKEGSWARHLEKELSKMEIQVSAVWGGLSLTMREILNLCEGDIISLDHDENSPVKVMAGSKTKYLGRPGVKNGKKVVRIENQEPLTE